MRNSINHCFVTLVLACGIAGPIDAQTDLQIKPNEDIQKMLSKVVQQHSLPGIVAGIAEPQQLQIGAAGIRKTGNQAAIEINDQLHLGSCTKAITATAIGRLVDRKMMTWDQTIAETLPELAAKIHEDYSTVTLLQLLSHRSGMPANANWWQAAPSGVTDMTRRRTLIAAQACRKKPKHAPGTNFQYSNLGYVVAALMAAKASGHDWETLVTDEIFKPLGMQSAGFGSPGTKDGVDQPWGHHMLGGQLKPTKLDNSPTLGPAGTIHANLADWARFALVHADAGNDFISAETRKRIQTPIEGQEYAFGWIVTRRPWADGIALTHSGSNTSWFCTVWVAPQKKKAYLAVTNVAGGQTPGVIDATIAKLIELDQK